MSDSKKVWFVTGASSGFGRELVEEVLSRGDRVVWDTLKRRSGYFSWSIRVSVVLPAPLGELRIKRRKSCDIEGSSLLHVLDLLAHLFDQEAPIRRAADDASLVTGYPQLRDSPQHTSVRRLVASPTPELRSPRGA